MSKHTVCFDPTNRTAFFNMSGVFNAVMTWLENTLLPRLSCVSCVWVLLLSPSNRCRGVRHMSAAVAASRSSECHIHFACLFARLPFLAVPCLARGCVPDFVLRFFIRQLLKQQLSRHVGTAMQQRDRLMAFVNELKDSPIAIATVRQQNWMCDLCNNCPAWHCAC
jgi:hypothetical protein